MMVMVMINIIIIIIMTLFVLFIRELKPFDPSAFSPEQDWTSKYNGSVTALRQQVENRSVILPAGGVILR